MNTEKNNTNDSSKKVENKTFKKLSKLRINTLIPGFTHLNSNVTLITPSKINLI